MGLLIFLLMIGVPIVEIVVFIKVGGWLGVGPTVAIVILAAIFGATLLRRQGFAVLMRVRESLAAGRLPLDEMFDGLCLLVAGVLLLTPGLVTDAIGFLLFVPPVRAVVRRIISAYLLASGRIHTPAGGPPRPPPGGPPVIEGEYEEVDDRRRPRREDGDGNPWRHDKS
jgi:UPF0716 protein FxsA